MGFDLSDELRGCRGEAYDNGSYMVSKNKGVQARLLTKNPTTFFSHLRGYITYFQTFNKFDFETLIRYTLEVLIKCT